MYHFHKVFALQFRPKHTIEFAKHCDEKQSKCKCPINRLVSACGAEQINH